MFINCINILDIHFVTFNHNIHKRHHCTIAMVSSFPPKQCGVGAFAFRLTQSLEKLGCEVDVFALRDDNDLLYNSSRVKYILNANNRADFVQAGNFLDNGFYDFVILQHEFSLYPLVGAESELVRTIKRVPVYSVVHNSHSLPTKQQLIQIQSLAKASTRIVVMSKRSRNSYAIGYGIPREKLRFIPHGVVDFKWDYLSSVNVNEVRKELGIPVDKKVILTFGLLHRKKGVQYLLDAMPYIVKQHPDAMLIVLGQVNRDETQRDLYSVLLAQAVSLNVQNFVRFNMRFIPDDALLKYLIASDVYVTPYLEYTPVSGTLSYAMATGRAVVTTNFMYAQELLNHNKRGRLARMANPTDIAKYVTEMLAKPEVRKQMGLQAYKFTRKMIWDRVAFEYLCQVSREPNGEAIKAVISQQKRFKCREDDGFASKCIRWRDHKSFKQASLTFAYFRGFDDRKIVFDVPLSSFFGSHVYNLLTDTFLQLNAKLKTELISGTYVSIVTSLGLRWSTNQVLIDAYSEKEPDLSQITPVNGIEVSTGTKYGSVRYFKFTKHNHYIFEFLLHKHGSIVWIDLHMIALNNLLSPHGLMGQTAKFIHHVDKKKCEGSLSEAKNESCMLFDGSLARYEVKDGIFGTQFHYNQFLESATMDNQFFCDTKFGESDQFQVDFSKDPAVTPYSKFIKGILPVSQNVVVDDNPTRKHARIMRIDACTSEIDAMAYTEYDEILTPSEMSKNCLVQSGVAEDTVFVMPFSVNTMMYRAIETDNFLSNFITSFKMLFRGKFNQLNGIDLILDQYQKAFTSADSIVLVVDRFVSVEEDKENAEFINKMLAKIEHMLSNAQYPKILYIEEDRLDMPLEQLYSSVDVLVYPYRSDIYGNVIIEAMSSALPVITSMNGSAADICDNFNSQLVPSVSCSSPLVCEPDPQLLLQEMRNAYINRAETKLKGQLSLAAIQLLRSEEKLKEILYTKLAVGNEN